MSKTKGKGRKDMPQYRELHVDEIDADLFAAFERTQVVTTCRRKVEGKWIVFDEPSLIEWGPAEYDEMIERLRNTLRTGGVVWGSFTDGRLKGFAAVEGRPMGSCGQYMELSALYVSSDVRSRGIGAVLFLLAADFARNRGIEKLYISAHSAVETQAFYRTMGCVEAAEPSEAHLERNPLDCQLKYRL